MRKEEMRRGVTKSEEKREKREKRREWSSIQAKGIREEKAW